MEQIEVKGHYILEHIRNGRVIGWYEGENMIMKEGKNTILDVFFNAGTSIPLWYIGLMDKAGFIQVLATDTMASHPGWAELISYTEATRQLWSVATPLNEQITNVTTAVFNFAVAANISGLFIVSNNTKTGTTGKLWAAVSRNDIQPIKAGDQFRATYQVQL